MENSDKNCGKDQYFGPLGRCQDCGDLCDKPAQYPHSCKIYCPAYVPKERTTTSQFPSTPSDQPKNSVNPLIIGAFSGLGALLLLSFILCWLWKKCLHKKFSRISERRRNRKLGHPVQVQGDQNEHTVYAALDNIGDYIDDIDVESAFSIVGNLENEVMNSIDDLETNEHQQLMGTERSDSTQTVITITDEIAFVSGSDFEFGETFPFHSLSSLDSVFEHSSDHTHRKTTAESS